MRFAPAKRNAVILLLLCLFYLCRSPSNCVASGKVKVTDMAHRVVEVPGDPQRIVCVGPGTLRLISFLGATRLVVGIEAMEKEKPVGRPYMLAHPDLAKLPTIGPGGPTSIDREPDLEAILKVRPDVIFISYMQQSNAIALQKKIGIPVIVLTHGRFAALDKLFYESLRVAGKVLQREKRAEDIREFVESIKKDCAVRTAHIDDSRKPSAYVGAVGYKAAQGIESTHGGYIPLQWIGANNLAKQISPERHIFIDRERLLQWDPDVIFIDGGGLLVSQDLVKRPEFYEGLKAFRQNRVFLLHPFNNYVTNIDTAMTDAYAAGKILFPQRFSDIDVKSKADEIYGFLLGKPLYEKMERIFGPLGRSMELPQ